MENLPDQLNANTLSTSILVACFAIGAWIGSWFPDIDQRIGFLRHRSVVTHGIWLPALAAAAAMWTLTTDGLYVYDLMPM